MDNVIYCNFHHEMREMLFQSIKTIGKDRTLKVMLDEDMHPSYAKAIIRNIMRNKGW